MEDYTVTTLLILFWAFLAIMPVLAQLRWGLLVALIVAGAEAGLIFLYASLPAGGLADSHMTELIAILYGLWVSLIGGGLAVAVGLIRHILAKPGSGSSK